MLLFRVFVTFWNDNSESSGCFPVQFLDAHIPTEKQTVKGNDMDSGCRCEKERESPANAVFRTCSEFFVLMSWSLIFYVLCKIRFVLINS